ncbi:MAG: hypothetical protein U0232_05325 [Thermomicrobiales bacterium]
MDSAGINFLGSASTAPSTSATYPWNSTFGWFSAAYGPFRRFTGGNSETEQLFSTNPKIAAHLTIFGEEVALSEALNWLRELNYKRLENDPEGRFSIHCAEFINQPIPAAWGAIKVDLVQWRHFRRWERV